MDKDIEFDGWFKKTMPNTHKGVGKEKMETFVYQAARDAWLAAKQQAVPDGFVVVPMIDTDSMWSVGRSIIEENGFSTDASDVYKAMIQEAQK